MSSIAYITDSTMLENHRLLRNKTMNFWRLSTNINFSDFGIGDLVFFLSKDRVHRRKGEKGIIGFGRLKELRVYSPSTMWRKYGKDNGYISKKSFEDALKKVSKDIEDMKFNTCVSTFMTMMNEFTKLKTINKAEFKTFITLLNPFAPHMTEELNEIVFEDEPISSCKWPIYDESKTIDFIIIPLFS